MSLKNEIKKILGVGITFLTFLGFSSIVNAEGGDLIESDILNPSYSFTEIDPNFDWNLLNTDGLDLSQYAEQTINKPVELKGGTFDDPSTQRKYYMFFGNVDNFNTINMQTNEFEKSGNIMQNLGTENPLPILAPVMIGVDKASTSTKQKVFGYIFDADYTSKVTASDKKRIGMYQSGFDIGDMGSDESGQNVIFADNAHGTWDSTSSYKRKTYIMKQYVKENEMVAYGWVGQAELPEKKVISQYIPVRVHGYVVNDDDGRLRYEMTFYNKNDQANYYAVNYGAHMDIGGAHEASILYSNGENGLYFDQPKAPVDKIGARIFFYQGKRFYGEKLIGPTDRMVGNIDDGMDSMPNAWGDINKVIKPLYIKNTADRPSRTNPYAQLDPFVNKYEKYPLSHPTFMMRYDRMKVEANSTATVNLDLSLNEVKPQYNLKVKYVDEEGNEIPDYPPLVKQYEGDSQFSEDVIDIPSYTFKALSGDSEGDLSEDGKKVEGTIIKDMTLTLIYEKNAITNSTITVHHYDEKGDKVEVAPDEIITDIVGSQHHLEPKQDIADFTFVRVDGPVDITMTETPQEVSFYYTPSAAFEISEAVTKLDGSNADTVNVGNDLKYTVNLKSLRTSDMLAGNYTKMLLETQIDTNLEKIVEMHLTDDKNNEVGIVNFDQATGKVTASIEESDQVDETTSFVLSYQASVKNDVEIGTEIREKTNATVAYSNGYEPNSKESNEVISVVEGGDLIFESAPNKLNFGEQKIESVEKEYDLSDFTGSLSIKDLRGIGQKWHLTGKVDKELANDTSLLNNSLFYIKDGIEYGMDTQNSVLIHEETTKNTDSVIISNEWNDNNKLVLKVAGGKAKIGNYEGAIRWTLVDAPSNS